MESLEEKIEQILDKSRPVSGGQKELKADLLALFSSELERVCNEIIGKDTRDAVNNRDVRAIVDLNEGNVTEDEVMNELQKDIDAYNALRKSQRNRLNQYLQRDSGGNQ